MTAATTTTQQQQQHNSPAAADAYQHASQRAHANLPKRKLVVVGDGAIGKTCLLVVYAQQSFPHKYVPTVFENYTAKVWIEESQQHVDIGLWDTAGQEDYDNLRWLSYDDTNVFLVAFSVDDWLSYEHVMQKWSQEIKHYRPTTPIILVALKTDLRTSEPTLNALAQSNQRPVTTEEGEYLAHQIGAVAYLECSALTGEGVNQVFQIATRATVKGGAATLGYSRLHARDPFKGLKKFGKRMSGFFGGSSSR
ncbi:GTP-binding protein Rho1 [Chytriomyces hyalinus]|nr:GTP-binding protein Rho1 [Chytriomyces hyalinus]